MLSYGGKWRITTPWMPIRIFGATKSCPQGTADLWLKSSRTGLRCERLLRPATSWFMGKVGTPGRWPHLTSRHFSRPLATSMLTARLGVLTSAVGCLFAGSLNREFGGTRGVHSNAEGRTRNAELTARPTARPLHFGRGDTRRTSAVPSLGTLNLELGTAFLPQASSPPSLCVRSLPACGGRSLR